MPLLDAHQPGMFCWVELAALDAAAVKKFYTELFGWTYKDFPMGEGGDEPYTIFQYRDRDVGATYSMMPEQRAQGMPPNWLAYVSVTNADDTLGRVAALGGTVMTGPMDVFEMGRMGVIQDPTGAMIAVWQPRSHVGARIVNEPGAFCWAELLTRDIAKAKTFYESLFGWKSEPWPDPNMEYTVFKVGEQPAGGMMSMPSELGAAPPHWLVYFAVGDCDATVQKATSAGASVFTPPIDIPNVGRMATLADPQGAEFAVLKAAMAAKTATA
jgi:uncharacterized protein